MKAIMQHKQSSKMYGMFSGEPKLFTIFLRVVLLYIGVLKMHSRTDHDMLTDAIERNEEM